MDTGATDHIICNSALLENIGPASVPKTVVTNAGIMKVDQRGFFPGIGEVYYHPGAGINVQSLTKLEDNYNLTIDYVPGKRFTAKNLKGSMAFL